MLLVKSTALHGAHLGGAVHVRGQLYTDLTVIPCGIRGNCVGDLAGEDDFEEGVSGGSHEGEQFLATFLLRGCTE